MKKPAAATSPSLQRPSQRTFSAVRPGLIHAAVAAALALPAAGRAVELYPFSITGFTKVEATRVSSYCPDCQVVNPKFVSKQFNFADDLIQGKPYGAGTSHVVLFQPYLGLKLDLPRGFKLEGLLSQRWRDGNPDFPGFLYEKNIGVSHEDYGSLRIGAMTTRTWALADYPYGSNLNVSDAWGSSGAGYGLLTRAVRYTSRVLDVAEGDAVIEGTYDIGESGWSKNKPRFFEIWAHYGHGDLVVDAMLQDAKNGGPSAFSHGPFSGLMAQQFAPVVDPLLGGSSQGIAMVMARYQVDQKLELTGGLRRNRWSGAYAKFLFSAANNPFGPYDLYNNPFNVDWSKDLGGGVFKGYPARSTDVLLGARYRLGQWTASTGLVYLGTAKTDNPSERGQSNNALINTIGLSYAYGHGFEPYLFAGTVRYGRLGLSPLSMPSNSAFTNIDSRLKTRGNWVGVGATYVF